MNSFPYAEPDEIERVASALRGAGYKGLVVTNSEIPRIETAMSGASVWLTVYATKSIQFRTLFNIDKAVTTIERVNNYNTEWRWAKVYLTDAALACECDFLFDISAAAASEDLDRMLSIYEGTLNRAIQLLRLPT